MALAWIIFSFKRTWVHQCKLTRQLPLPLVKIINSWNCSHATKLLRSISWPSTLNRSPPLTWWIGLLWQWQTGSSITLGTTNLFGSLPVQGTMVIGCYNSQFCYGALASDLYEVRRIPCKILIRYNDFQMPSRNPGHKDRVGLRFWQMPHILWWELMLKSK